VAANKNCSETFHNRRSRTLCKRMRCLSSANKASIRSWTQVRAAEELGIDRSYISDMERGKKNVCLPTMEVLAQGFEISLAQLVRGVDREEPAKRKR
jgi:ribosome-binding protein aMBF1 (putative translation factor)